MATYLETFGAVYLPTHSSRTPVSIGPVNVAGIPIQGGGLMDPYGASDQVRRKGGSIAYDAVVWGRTEAEFLHKLDQLRAQMGKRARLTGVFPGCTPVRRWVNARMLDTSGSISATDTKHATVTLAFLVLSPWWYAASQTALSYTDIYQDDDDDLPTTGAGGYDLGGSVPMGAIDNTGTVPVTDATFTVTASGGAVTSVTIVNTTTNYTLIWQGTLADTKSLVIDCGARSILNDGVDAYAGLTEPTNHEYWMELAPGENQWLLRLTGADAAVEVEFYPAYG